MQKDIKKFIDKEILNIVKNTYNKLESVQKKCSDKIHFIPKKYMVLNSLLQSINIQFGNFIEELMKVIINNEEKYEIIEEYSGKKNNNFLISISNEKRIDEYINNCSPKFTKEKLQNNFLSLQNKIIEDNNKKLKKIRHDIDLLFRNKENDKIYYLEIKYDDNHDSRKFMDINRKFIRTYAYLVKELEIKNINKLTPILLFFTDKTLKENKYVPRETNIRRVEEFFNEFLSIKYNELNKYLINISESEDIIKMFDDLYNKVMKI